MTAVLAGCLRRSKASTGTSGIPLVLLPLARQRAFIEATFSIAPGRGFLHFSYCITSPLPSGRHGLTTRREAWTLLNLPPASVWRYTPILAGGR